MWKCQVLILYSDAGHCDAPERSYEHFLRSCQSSLPLWFLLIYWLQLFSQFCYLHPKICPSVFRNSVRIHCCLKIDNKWGCLLRSCPALACCCFCCLEFLSAEVWITLEETSLPGGPSQCFGEAMECSRDVVTCRLRLSPKEPKVYPICRTTPEAC